MLSGFTGELTLVTQFHPDPSSDDLSEEFSVVVVEYNPKAPCPLKVKAQVQAWGESSGAEVQYYPLPPLYLICEEVDFMFNLLKSLDYGSSQESPRPEIAPDISPV